MIARFLVLVCLLPFAFANASAAPIEIVVGVRADAPPFSFAQAEGPRFSPPGTGPLFAQGYDGYVAQICDVALEMLTREVPDLTVRTVEVKANTRFPALGDDAPEADRIDILCDPATITADRVKGLYASVPIYLSGISFAYRDPFPEGEVCASVVGAVAETTTETRGMEMILDSGKWPRYRARIAEALVASHADRDAPAVNQEPAVASGGCNAPVIFWANDHDTLARAFCEGKVLYYVGDVELIRSKLKFLNEDGACSFVIDDSTYTEERYAVFARIPAEVDKARAILRFFSILAEEIYTDKAKTKSVLIESYGRAFKDYRPSRRLQAFYWSLTGDTGTSE